MRHNHYHVKLLNGIIIFQRKTHDVINHKQMSLVLLAMCMKLCLTPVDTTICMQQHNLESIFLICRKTQKLKMVQYLLGLVRDELFLVSQGHPPAPECYHGHCSLLKPM